MPQIKLTNDLFEAAANLDRSNGGNPVLADILRAMSDDIASLKAVPSWSPALPVSANVLVLPFAGTVLAVHATTGTTPGPKQMISTGVPAAGQVLVAYNSTTGVATLTFAAGDAVTAASVQGLLYSAPSTVTP